MYYQKKYIGRTFLVLAQTKGNFYILPKIFTWIVYLFIILIITLHSYCVALIYELLKEKKKKRTKLQFVPLRVILILSSRVLNLDPYP